MQVVFHPVPGNERWWYIIQVSPRSKQIFEGKDIEAHLEEVQNIMNRIHTIVEHNGPTIEDKNEEESDKDDEASVEDDQENASLDDFVEGSIHLMLDESDMENEGDLENIDGTSIYIDVYARQGLLEDDNI